MGRHSDSPDAENNRLLADEVAAGSDHHAVTTDLLTGDGRFANTYYLYDEPVIAYLATDERPQFAFYNEVKGVGVGTAEETFSPDPNGISIVLLTERRVLGLVGRSEGDEVVSVHYDVVTGASYSTEGFHDRFVVETTDETYHFWITTRFEESELAAAVRFVRGRMADPRTILEGGSPGEPTQDVEDTVVSDGGPIDEADVDGVGDADSVLDRGSVTDRESSVAGPADEDEGEGEAEEDEDPLDRIERLHQLVEAGAITRAEYEEKKSDLLDRV